MSGLDCESGWEAVECRAVRAPPTSRRMEHIKGDGMQVLGELQSCHLCTSQNDRTGQGQVGLQVMGAL